MSRPNAAADRLAEVRRRTSDGIVRLAYHAALPVVVDPGLLNLMRVNFFLDPPDALPFQAEAALLLSPLFREIGDDLYEIDSEVRNLLLIGLNTRYGTARVRQVALLLEHYAESTPSWNAQPELQQAQRLTALSFIDPDRARAWLRDAQTGAEPGTLSREWFVAMGQSLASQAHDVTVEDEVAAVIGRLSSERLEERLDAIRTLGALSRLPDTDPAPIVVALHDFLGPSVPRAAPEDLGAPADFRSAASLLKTLPVPILRGGVEWDTVDRVPGTESVPSSAERPARSAGRRSKSVARVYSRYIEEQFGYLATWLPTMPVKVGDIGIFQDDIFIRTSNAAELGLTIKSERAAGYSDFTGSSETSAEFIQMGAEESVDAVPSVTSSAPSRLEIRMRGEGVLVHWKAIATERVISTAFPTLAQSVLDLSRLGNWRDDWIIVTDVLHVRGGIVLISGADESHVTFRTTGPVIESSPLATIDDPTAQLIEQSGMLLTFLEREEFTPCFRASRVRRRLLRTSREFVPVSIPR